MKISEVPLAHNTGDVEMDLFNAFILATLTDEAGRTNSTRMLRSDADEGAQEGAAGLLEMFRLAEIGSGQGDVAVRETNQQS